MPTIGDTTDYATKLTLTGNTKSSVRGALFNVPSGYIYSVTSMTAKIYYDGTTHVKMGIYKLVNGLATAELVATTEEITVTNAYGVLKTANFASAIGLTEGSYVFAIIYEHGIGIYHGAKTGYTENYNKADNYDDGFTATYGTGGNTNSNYSFCIYGTYTSARATVPGNPNTILTINDNAIDDETLLDISLHLGCTREVSSFTAVIDRGNPNYDQLLDPGEANVLTNGTSVTIQMGRGTLSLMLTGILEEIEYEDEVEEYGFRNIVIVNGRCEGYQLFAKKFNGDLIDTVGTGDANYKKVSGDAESLVAYLIDNYTSLSHSRENSLLTGNAASAQADVDVTDGTLFAANDLVKIYDDNAWEYNEVSSVSSNTLTMKHNLNHTYTTAANAAVAIDLIEATNTSFTEMQYSHTTIFEIIKFIAEVSSNTGGSIGYDTRIEYDGQFAFFSIGSKIESYTLQDDVQLQRYIKDSTRVKNDIDVYGKADMPYPVDADGQIWSDAWTELTVPFNKTHLAANAASGQKDVTVNAGDGANFSADDWVFITDDTISPRGELIQINSIATDTLTMKTNLVNAWATADNGILFEVSPSGGWGFGPSGATNDITVSQEASIAMFNNKSVKVVGNNAIDTYFLLFPLLATEYFNANLYNSIKVHMYFATTTPKDFRIVLWSGGLTSNEYAMSPRQSITTVDDWIEGVFTIGEEQEASWIGVGSSFDWTDIRLIEIRVYYAAAGTNTFYIDGLHAFGRRWGGGYLVGTNDGSATDATSITTYGTREMVFISDLMLSAKECELKAQALLNYYKDEEISLEVITDTLDWEGYHPMAGNKVAVDLDFLGVTGSTYRIDSIDIRCRSADNKMTVVFTLNKHIKRTADYLYEMSRVLREQVRAYGAGTIR